MQDFQATSGKALTQSSRRETDFCFGSGTFAKTKNLNDGKNSQQIAQAMRIDKTSRFQIEPTAFETLKQALDFPPTPIVKEQVSWLIAGNNQIFAVRKPLSSQINRYLPKAKNSLFTRIFPSKELTDFPLPIFLIENKIIFSDSNTKADILPVKIAQPIFSDELSISSDEIDFSHAKYSKELLEKSNPFSGMTVSFVVQSCPEKRNGTALDNDSENEEVDLLFPPVPVGSIDSENPRSLRQKGGENLSEMSGSYLEVCQESPNSYFVGFGGDLRIERLSEPGQGDASFGENSKNEREEKVALHSEWSYTLGKGLFEKLERFRSGHLVRCFLSGNSKLPLNDQAVSLLNQTGKLFVSHSGCFPAQRWYAALSLK